MGSSVVHAAGARAALLHGDLLLTTYYLLLTTYYLLQGRALLCYTETFASLGFVDPASDGTRGADDATAGGVHMRHIGTRMRTCALT